MSAGHVFVGLWTLLSFGKASGLWPEVTRSSIVSGCSSINLQCPSGSLMVVVQASYTPGTDCNISDQAQLTDNWHIWESVVARCNGYTEGNCVYNLSIELPESRRWGRGRLDVIYRCETAVSSYCGGKIDINKPGYIISPGYPKYYLGGRDCVWTLHAPVRQTLKINLLDLNLQTGDCLSMLEASEVKLEHCGSINNTLSITSSTNKMSIRLGTSTGRIYALRGFLVEYRLVGCTLPPPLTNAQADILNSTHARYTCGEGMLFKSAISSSKVVECSGTTWLVDPEDCMSINEIVEGSNQSLIQALQHYNSNIDTSAVGLGMEIGGTIVVGVFLVISLGVALVLYCRHRDIDPFYIQDDEIKLKDSMSRQIIPEDIERY